MPRKRGETKKTSALGVRITPRAKHLIDIICRNRRLSVTALFELAIENYASGYEMRIADSTWSVLDAERLDLLHKLAPKLLSFEEEKRLYVKAEQVPLGSAIHIPAGGIDPDQAISAARSAVGGFLPGRLDEPAVPPEKIAVSPDEAGRISGHTRSAIYAAIACGDLPSFKSGKRRLILRKELLAWLQKLSKDGRR